MTGISAQVHLLPPRATVPEKAAASLGVLADRLHDPIGDMADAARVPLAALPHLAWSVSADAYDPRWTEQRQRQVVGEWVPYHERKTSIAGIRMALGYHDVELVAYHLPRHGFFCDGPVEPAEQARWVEGLPEIRIYDPAPAVLPDGPVGHAGVDLFADGDARLARKAAIYRDGAETPVAISPVGGEERIVLPAAPVDVLVAGDPSSRFVAPAEIRQTVLAVRPITSGENDYVRPVAAAGDKGAFVKARRHTLPGSFPPFSAVDEGGLLFAAPAYLGRGYVALKLSSEAGRLTGHKALNVVGTSRITPAAYSAEWTVDISRRVPFAPEPEGRVVASSPEPRVREVSEAVQSASALRDTSFLSLKATRRLTFADLRSVQEGQRFGDRRRIINYA